MKVSDHALRASPHQSYRHAVGVWMQQPPPSRDGDDDNDDDDDKEDGGSQGNGDTNGKGDSSDMQPFLPPVVNDNDPNPGDIATQNTTSSCGSEALLGSGKASSVPSSGSGASGSTPSTSGGNSGSTATTGDGTASTAGNTSSTGYVKHGCT